MIGSSGSCLLSAFYNMAVDILPISPSEPLELLGEQYPSAASGEVKHEHYHRYFFALQFCDKKDVLDIASGEGYGSALLEKVAQEVLGVDLSPEMVSRATRNYGSARVSFSVGDCAAIPLSDASVDVAVSFKTLEHVTDRKKFFGEIKRVLRPDGILVISSPNVEVQKDPAIEPRPANVDKLDGSDFCAILREHFSNYRLFGQRSVIGSAIAPDSSVLSEADRQQTFRAADSRVYSVLPGIGPPTYFIAVASDIALREIQHGLLDDRPFLTNLYDLLEKRAIAIRELDQLVRAAQDRLQQQLRDHESELTEVSSRASSALRELHSREDELAQLRAHFERQLGVATSVRNGLEQQLRNRVCELTEMRTRLSQIVGKLQSRDDELTQLRALVAGIYGSNSWQLTRPMRFLGRIVGAFKVRCVRLAERLGLCRLFGPPAFEDRRNFGAPEVRFPLPLGDAGQPGAAPATAASARPETELEVLQGSGLFDTRFYCEANPEVGASEMSPPEHFLYVGAFAGRRPNPLFDPAYYLSTYPDVAKAGVNPVLHYFLSGSLEGRDPSPEFNTSFYLEANPDVAASGVNPLVHFLRFGGFEGRLPSPPQGAGPETELQVLQRSGLFDAHFYCEANPDVAAGKISPLEHYLNVGAFEGRRANPLFDSAYYLSSYLDVAKAGVNPVLHYFLSGALEGRDPSPEFDTSFYLEANPDVAASGVNPLVHFLRLGAQEGRSPVPRESYERELRELGRLAAAHHQQEKLGYRPLLSVLMPAYDTQPIYLEAAARSVVAQAYPNWELRIIDDGSTSPATLESLERVAAGDKRIFISRYPHCRGNSRARNDALHDARGEYVAILDHGDELTADALYEVVLALNADPRADVVYTDEDYIALNGEQTTCALKPDWSLSLFRGVMYVGHLLTVRRSLALEVGGFDPGFDLVQDFELMLRISERTRKIRHVSKVLYRRRQIPESVANREEADSSTERLQAAAVQAHLGRLRFDGSARPNPRHAHRVYIEPGRRPRNTTFDLIVHGGPGPTAGSAAINSALVHAARQAARVVVPAVWSTVEIVGNGTVDLLFADAHRGLSEAQRLSRFLAESSAEFVVAVSADIVIETDDWMEWLVLATQECDVAVVCPSVLSADGLLAHAGLVVGRDGAVRPAMRGFEPDSDGYAGSLSCAREISAAWADLVLLRRSPLVSLLPPDPAYVTADFFVADLTLRATRSGLRAICVPNVRVRRLSTTDADGDHRLDGLVYQDLWAGEAVGDPFYNPNFIDIRADYCLPA
jgi:O-antigen biosynthesis protein